jgi:two-component system chemotaxis response regulator CheY
MAKTILVVDDSMIVRRNVSFVLKRAGFMTVEAADGSEGVAAVDANANIDMVICDINMPNMNGFEVVEKIKSKAENKSLPIVMLTTEGQMIAVKRAKEAGAVGWIVKPFDPAQLVQTVSHLTRAGRPDRVGQAPAALTGDDG